MDQDNHKFEEWCTEMAEMRRQSVDKGKAKHEEVKELYELLPVQDGELPPTQPDGVAWVGGAPSPTG